VPPNAVHTFLILMKKLIYLLSMYCSGWAYSQPVINERYDISELTNSILGSVIATDSGYYSTGIHTSSPLDSQTKAVFVKFNLEGGIDDYTSYESDTIGLDLWYGYNLLQFKKSFVQIGTSSRSGFSRTFYFVRLNPAGDILSSRIVDDYLIEGKRAASPSEFILFNDKIFGILNIQDVEDFTTGSSLFNIDTNGVLNNLGEYYSSHTDYLTLRANSFIQYDTNKFIIGANMLNLYADNIDKRFHTKLLVVDSLGNLLDEHTYWDDRLSLDCNGLTKTADGGLLYCGRNGIYYEEFNGLLYKGRIVKLDSEFNVEWELTLGKYNGESGIGLNDIKQLNEREFIAVGHGWGEGVQSGWLVKFNIDGEVIWERKYFKVPHFEGEVNYPEHILYDVDITTDSGFVMVGQAMNYYEDNGYLYGQKAWLVKANKYGCLVPGCQIGDSPAYKDKDSINVSPPQPPVTAPDTWLYPNPVSNTLFYFHHRDQFVPATAQLYSSTGQKVQEWKISENNITYEVDVSQFAGGTYIFVVRTDLGEVLYQQKVIVLR
jgi:hypothetical protein